MSPTVWWIIGIVVALVVLALAVRSASARRAEAHRDEAASIREEALGHEGILRAHQASAEQAEARSRQAQAEADEAAARARELRVESERREQVATEVQETRDEQLRRADALDPDVRTDKEGYRVDGDGKRLPMPSPTPDDRTGRDGVRDTGGDSDGDRVTSGRRTDRHDWSGLDGRGTPESDDDRPTLGEEIRAEVDAERAGNDSHERG